MKERKSVCVYVREINKECMCVREEKKSVFEKESKERKRER